MVNWAQQAVISPLVSVSTGLASIGGVIRDLPISMRKDLLLICRVRDDPRTNAFLYKHLQHFSSTTHFLFTTHSSKQSAQFDAFVIYDIFSDLIITSPWYSSFFSMLLRNTEYGRNYEYIEAEAKRESCIKEFQATQQPKKNQVLNYDWMFSERCNVVHPTIPPRYEVSQRLRQCLSLWKKRVSSQLIYPKTSSRSMSKETGDILRREDPFNARNKHVSSEDVEGFYHRTGIMVGGVVEMRQAWFFNDLKARTYFAQGGKTYKTSRYVQPVFNLLLDVFPMTHRIRRFNLDRLQIPSRARLLVYDFSSFTSSMSEQYYFIRSLAEYCRDTTVTIVDTYDGLVDINLGDLLDSYNEDCNNYPEFVLSEQLRELTGKEDLIFCHQCAGFLGVHGNLASCTVLHGIVLAFITGSFSRCSCVGDDALAVLQLEVGQLEPGEIGVLEDMSDVLMSLKSIGSIADHKTAEFSPTNEQVWDNEVWTYLKRSLRREETHLSLTWQVEFPSLGLIFHDQQRTTRKLRFEMTPDAVTFRAITHITSFLFKVSTLDISDQELLFCWQYLWRVYKHLGLPVHGFLKHEGITGEENVPCQKSVLFIPWLPRSAEELEYLRMYSPLENILRAIDFEWMNVPVVSFSQVEDLITYEAGSSFRATGTKWSSLMEKLGYLSKSSRVQLRSRSDSLEYLADFFHVKSSLVYDFCWSRDPPFWIRDIIQYQ